MTLRLIETPHIHTPASLLTNGTTSNDFAFPAWKWEMHEGENYAVWIEAAGQSILLIPSGGDIMEQLNAEGIQADTVFLGVGYTGRLNEQEWDQLWEKAVVDVGASRVALVHWDDMQGMVDGKSMPNDLEPWELFWLDRVWARVQDNASQNGIEVLHIQPGRALEF